MKKFKDIKVGDTVYVYGGLEPVQRFTVTYIEEFDINNPHKLYYCIGYDYFGSKPKSYQDSVQSSCRLSDTSSTFGCYAATVYFNQEDVIKRFNEDIKTLERYKQDFINKTMTQEDKDLLIKDLCGRLPYNVKVDITYSKEHGSSDRLRICSEGCLILNTDILGLYIQDEIYLKPYLRPMSSMTEEESKEFAMLQTDFYIDGWLYPIAAVNMVNWLIVHHFDYHNLIEKGLAIEVTESNNLYKE